MQVPNSHADLGRVELNHIFTESLLRLKYFVELSSLDEGHDKVESLRGLKQVVHADKEGVVTTKQNIFFQLGVLNLVVLNQHILANCFDRIELLFLNKFSQENLSESSTAQQHF